MNRASRSNSLTTPLHNPLVYGAKVEQSVVPPPPEYVPSQPSVQAVQAVQGGGGGRARERSRTSISLGQRKRSPSSSSQEDDDDDDEMADVDSKVGVFGQETMKSSPPPCGGGGERTGGNRSRESSRERPSVRARQSGSQSQGGNAADGAGGGGVHPGNEIPQEFRADVDRVFFEFLNKICSNRTFCLYYSFFFLFTPLQTCCQKKGFFFCLGYKKADLFYSGR